MNSENELSKILNEVMKKRWLITLIVLLTFLGIIVGIGLAVMFNSDVNEQWEKLLMLLLGAFIGSYGKIMDYWFNDPNKDKMFIDSIDEEKDKPKKKPIRKNKSGDIKPPLL
jgi:predicted PurR-regulated permease PerM